MTTNKYRITEEMGLNNGKYHNRINWEYVARCLLKSFADKEDNNLRESDKWYYAAIFEMERQADIDDADASMD